MSTLNWKIFSSKYDQKETSAFEDLSYLLFCAEFGNRIGIFRFKNQAGIETEPINQNGIVCGFQSKYYTTSISSNKVDIIDSVKKAQRENPTINKLLFYINQEFSESTKIGQKKPQYQLDIESEAIKINVEIDWRVPSYFELQLILPENKYIFDLFFSLDPNGGDLIDEVKEHTENILHSIQTQIVFNELSIKIDRSDLIRHIKQSLDDNQHLIISGEGGCGKTAVVKDFYSEFTEYPICIFKATEFNISNINDLFLFAHSFSFEQFIDTFKLEPKKLFIIDSAEKLAELNNSDILQKLIRELKNDKWTIVFTTRHCYLDDLQFHIKQTYHLPCEVTNISHLNEDKLLDLSNSFGFNLPDNQKFKDRLKNLFYLNEYIQEYSSIDRGDNLNSFIDLLWRKRIQGSARNSNIDVEREDCFLDIAFKRCNSGQFYIRTKGMAQNAVFALEQDDIINRDKERGYFITHDIYEEWALDKMISRSYADYFDSKRFFEEIGDSLPMRRAFRIWLSEQIADNIDNITGFIKESFLSNNISQFWKDELIVSVLLSDYSNTFFTQFEKEIIADDFKVLNRILFLLRIACTEIDGTKNTDSNDSLITRPKGIGWEAVIEFIYKHRDEYFENHLKLVLPILTDWNDVNKEGNTNRLAGSLALSLIDKRALTNDFYIDNDIELIILKIIYNAAKELKYRLKQIFDDVVTNIWVRHNEPYEELCRKILEKPYLAIDVIKVLPISVLQLCDLFWKKIKDEEDDFSHSYEMEERYGLTNEFRFDYYPSSALQTPIYWLLQNTFWETIEFIIDFTNRSVETYSKSDYGKGDIKQVVLYFEENKEASQYLSWALWGMYRGIGSPVTPHLLQSIHMALEKILLEYANILDPRFMEKILILILSKSKSASLTAIVCSIVLAYPDKFTNVALILSRTIELFHIDALRSTNEFTAKTLYSIGSIPNKQFYTDERLKTCEEKHRNLNLETLFVNYQLFGSKGATEEENRNLINTIYSIIDQHKISIQSKPKDKQTTFGILLGRMDRRTMHPTVKKQDDHNFIIELNPKLAPELKEYSEQATKQYSDLFRYSSVKMWSIYKCEGNTDASKYPQYETNPLAALKEAQEILTEIKKSADKLFLSDEIIPSFVCAALIRFYHAELPPEDLSFCKEVVVSRICDIFNDNYNYQISDGVEVAVHSVPHLIKLFPEEIPQYKRILLFALFDESKIGEYKRICDYVIETINQEKLWEISFEDTKSLLYAYISIKPKFNKSFKAEKPHPNYQFGQKRTSKQNVLKKVENEIKNLEFNNISIQLTDLDSFSIEDLEVIFQLIPYDTQEKDLLSIIMKILPNISSLLMKDGKHDHRYSLRTRIFRKFASFILNRNMEEIQNLIKPFTEKISGNEESKIFITELVLAEDIQCKVEQFWSIWKLLYDSIINQNFKGYNSKDVIIEYMLAWRWWGEGIEEWHSLKAENLSFYENVANDLGRNPAALYSISKVLNSIGSHFIDDGIKWIYTIVSKNKELQMNDQEANTLFYLERLMRKFIFMNKDKIKHENRLKKQIVPILEFMIDRGSVHGYLLRESVL